MKIELKDKNYWLARVDEQIAAIQLSQNKIRLDIKKRYEARWFNKLFKNKFKGIEDLDSFGDFHDCLAWEFPDKYFTLLTLKNALDSKNTGIIFIEENEYNLIK